MKTKSSISVNEAIEEAISMGFTNRYILHNNSVYSLLTNADFPESDYAIVKSYRVRLKNANKGYIHYIVLTNGQLGFILDEANTASGNKQDIQFEEETISNKVLEHSFRE